MVSFEEFIQKGRWSDAEERLDKLKGFHVVKKGYDLVRGDSTVPLGFLRKIIRRMVTIDPKMGYQDWTREEKVVLNSLKPTDSIKCYQAALEVVGEHYFEGIPERVNSRYKWFLTEKVTEIWEEFIEGHERWTGAARESATTQLRAVSNLSNLARQAELRAVWRKTELLVGEYNLRIQKHYDPSKTEKNHLLVHSLTSMDCPVVVIWLALRLYPDQIQTRDQFGNLPLHIVASRSEGGSSYFRGIFPSYLASAGASTFELIFRRFPAGSRFANNEGSLPLSIVLRTGGNRAQVDELVEAAPEALTTRDPRMRLWPYLLAAHESSHSASCTSLVYSLLRSNPSVLSLRNRSEVENLEDRLHDLLRKRNKELEAENAELKREIGLLKVQSTTGKRKVEGNEEICTDKKSRTE